MFLLTHLQSVMHTFSIQVQLLGVHLECDLSLEMQVSSIVKACFFYPRALSRVRLLLMYYIYAKLLML